MNDKFLKEEAPIKTKGHFRRNWFFYTLLIAALGLAGFLWLSKSIALKNQATVFETEKNQIIQRAQEDFNANMNQHLSLTSKTFAWAVRSELIRGNKEQADQYFTQLVKNKKIDEITFIDTNGKIILSTNKKKEGTQLTTDFATEIMKLDETKIIDKGVQQVVASPILSLDSHMGTLFILYKTDALQALN